MTKLEKIFAIKRGRVNEQKRSADLDRLAESAIEARRRSPPGRLRSALTDGSGFNIIAEYKRASPSLGVINDLIEPADMARSYQAGGASAISVLTEEDHFQGSIQDLSSVRAAVSLPLLRKDFIFDEFQILEAAAAGADAVLLIGALLPIASLKRLLELAENELALDALVEVHTEEEMRIATDIGATLIGVNNRDLRTFEVSLDVSRRLVKHAPRESILVAESGLKSSEDLEQLHDLGYSGFLIGENLMRSDDPKRALRELAGRGRE